MPSVLRRFMAGLFVLATVCAAVVADDRYSDWRSGEPPIADERPLPQEQYHPIPDEDAQAATPVTSAPASAQPIRKLPFRFERAPAGYDGGQIIRASAMEPAKRLPRPSTASRDEKSSRHSAGQGGSTSATPFLSVAGSVAIVIGLFLIVAWMARRSSGSIPSNLPKDVLEVLGRKRFAGKQEMQLVRLGNKLILVHVVPGHAETLGEITDPVEVDRLTGICYQSRPRSSTKTFRETFDNLAQERPAARPATRPPADKLDLSIFEGIGRRAS